MCEERKLRTRRPKPANELEDKIDIFPGNIYYPFQKHYAGRNLTSMMFYAGFM
jgi:hypothetical protein